MPYCTDEDVATRLGAADLAVLADHDGDGEADPAVVAQAIAHAQALMDSYLGVRYRVPVSLPGGGVPDVLTVRAVNLAVHFLRLGRDSVTDDARAQHLEDVAWLERAAAGAVSLGVEDGPGEAGRAPGACVESQGRIFGRTEPL